MSGMARRGVSPLCRVFVSRSMNNSSFRAAGILFVLMEGPGEEARTEGFQDRCGFYCLHRMMGPGIGECSSGHRSGQP